MNFIRKYIFFIIIASFSLLPLNCTSSTDPSAALANQIHEFKQNVTLIVIEKILGEETEAREKIIQQELEELKYVNPNNDSSIRQIQETWINGLLKTQPDITKTIIIKDLTNQNFFGGESIWFYNNRSKLPEKMGVLSKMEKEMEVLISGDFLTIFNSMQKQEVHIISKIPSVFFGQSRTLKSVIQVSPSVFTLSKESKKILFCFQIERISTFI